MGFEKNYEAREIITNIMQKDLLGPVEDDEIIIKERPLEYYILGKLYPKNYSVGVVLTSASEDCGDLDEEDEISLSNSQNPSSCGITFSLADGIKSFSVSIAVAKYRLITKDEARLKLGNSVDSYSESDNFWQRKIPNILPQKVNVGDLLNDNKKVIELEAGLLLVITLHKVYSDGSKTITVSLVNDNPAKRDYLLDCINSYFQPEIHILADEKGSFIDVRRNVHLNTNPEIAELEMLYSQISDYASGHGCAVNWKTTNDEEVSELYTSFFPQKEVLQMMPSRRFDNEVLQMNYIAEADRTSVIKGLRLLTEQYKVWIEDLKVKAASLAPQHKQAAEINISKCEHALCNINASIDALSDDIVFRSFALANKAMFMQRKNMLINTGKYISDAEIKWYPFQLAFFLQEIVSFANPNSSYRSNVDLLWFPTGGGKTEAYLGIAAFAIFLRRFRNPDNCGGVSVLMRYTLRLLSFQQFERASALICACELIRRNESIPGGEIGIGLWAGQALTPNKIDVADKILHGGKDEDAESSNPVQIEKCPWCGNIITPDDYSCDHQKIRMTIRCSNNACEFHNGLPLYLIDEEIYEHTPSFIVATIDKFAQVALNSETFKLFGCEDQKLPPDLIIQDELHLISGPLGTITGLYEAAIKKMCEINGVVPKVIASTATIRNAKEQILALYASDYTQFPPQGIDINDSFFAELSSKKEKPARLYLGCMGIGTSPTTMMIRVFSSLLYASRYNAEQGFDDKVVDSFWTLTGYFNTLRELGGALIRVVDDIQDRFDYLKTKFAVEYPIHNERKRYDRYKELTSREKSENIGAIIQKELKEEYKSDGTTSPYDFLLSSNMISVGVDVGRLGAMVVVGQPKSSSEYIQATSRVGRETPGLVIATYNQSKSRDRSHYEEFTQYHSMFYRFVEATSVTPFSDRARDRALQALYVMLCRSMIPQLSKDADAKNYNRSIPALSSVREYIRDYVSKVDPKELDQVMNDLDSIEQEWEDKASRREKLRYRKTKFVSQDDVLFDPDYLEDSRFRVLNTMRSVETTVKVSTLE